MRHLCGWAIDDERNPRRLRALGPDVRPQRALSVVDAVCAAIASLPTAAMRQRFAGAIVLVGGGAHLRGFAEHLEQRLWAVLPGARQPAVGSVEVLRPPRVRPWADTDPAHLAWRGAAVLLISDAQSLTQVTSLAGRDGWVERREWMLRGALVLREKVPFLW
jgi:actin-related protein